MSTTPMRSPRRPGPVALASLLVVTATASTTLSCGQILGIEETTLATSESVVCDRPIIPYIWDFSSSLQADASFDLFVIPRDAFDAICATLQTTPLADRGHLSVDVRQCPKGDELPPGEGVRLEVFGGPADATEFYFRGPQPVRSTSISNPGTEAPLTIGGFLNLPEGTREVSALPLAINEEGKLNAKSAARSVTIRRGFLTTLRLEPNAGGTKLDEPTPAGWECLGKSQTPPEPPSPSPTSIKLTARLFDFTGNGLVPTPGIKIKACGRNDQQCDITGNELPGTVATADANGLAELTLDTPTGSFQGYIVVRGSVRKTDDARCK